MACSAVSGSVGSIKTTYKVENKKYSAIQYIIIFKTTYMVVDVLLGLFKNHLRVVNHGRPKRRRCLYLQTTFMVVNSEVRADLKQTISKTTRRVVNHFMINKALIFKPPRW